VRMYCRVAAVIAAAVSVAAAAGTGPLPSIAAAPASACGVELVAVEDIE
jgi:hypothetical protein